MNPPNTTTTEMIDQLCRSRIAQLQGLYDGCMPGSMCALAHFYPYAFWLTLVSGVLLGLCAARAWQTHRHNQRERLKGK